MKQNLYLKFLRGSYTRVILLGVMGILSSACGVYLAFVSKSVVDMATGQMEGDLLRTAMQLGAVILIQLAFQTGITLLHVHTSVSLRFRIQSELYERFLRKQKLATDRFHSGEIVHRLAGDAGIVAGGIAEIFPSLLSISARIIFSFTALFILDWVLAVLCIVAGFLMLIAAYIYRKKTGDIFRKNRENEGKIRTFIQETAQNFAVIQAFSVQSVMRRLLGKAQRDSYKLILRTNHISIGATVAMSMAMTIGYYAALGWGAWRIFSGAITFGTLTAVLGLIGDISTPFEQIASLFPQYLSFCASAERLEEIENLPANDFDLQEEPKSVYQSMTAIQMEHVTFAYEDAKILDGLSGELLKGKFTAVCGKSGIGKSTLLNLLLGIYQAESGRITALLESGEQIPLSACRRMFAYVPQEFMLLSGTVLENITLFEENPDLSRFEKALSLACLTEEVEQFPDSWHTDLGENGGRLSGGQRQRMAIARALYADADILLMDESTSALSADMEKQILENLRKTGKTVIFVTHRKTAVELCDTVLYLEQGTFR
ncbi:MAG: ABC transporter ATP-binding protein [Clostridia bacterium]|nr:ABC transporter ATP-binding protein [Clostridia bacterium]